MSDQLSLVLERLSLRAGVFYSGNLCGLFDYNNAGTPQGHIHIVRKGTLRIARKNHDMIVINQPGVVLFPTPVVHTMMAEASDDAEVICATLEYGVGMNNLLSQTLPQCIVLALADVPALDFSIQGMLHESASAESPGRQQIMNRYMEVFFISILRHLQQTGEVQGGVLSGLAHPALCKALTAMHENPAHRWSLQTLADEAFQSRSKFAETFKQIVGVPALEYLTHWRVNLGKSMLLNGKQVTYVASEVGYDSASSFTKAFKKIEGCTPKNWLTGTLAA